MKKSTSLDNANSDFRSIDRDIREHEWAKDNYNVSFTDSTNPISVILSQFNDPELEYAFVLDNPSRIVMKKLEGYEIVDPGLMGDKREIFMHGDTKDRISTGDLILMRRPKSYRVRINNEIRMKTKNITQGVLQQSSGHRINNIESPFSE